MEGITKKVDNLQAKYRGLRGDLILLKIKSGKQPNWTKWEWKDNSCHIDSWMSILMTKENLKWTIDNLIAHSEVGSFTKVTNARYWKAYIFNIREHMLQLAEHLYSNDTETFTIEKLWHLMTCINPYFSEYGQMSNSIASMSQFIEQVASSNVKVAMKSKRVERTIFTPSFHSLGPKQNIAIPSYIFSENYEYKLEEPFTNQVNIFTLQQVPRDKINIIEQYQLDKIRTMICTGFVLFKSAHFISVILEDGEWWLINPFNKTGKRTNLGDFKQASMYMDNQKYVITTVFYKTIEK
jgi:hypothetical protein